MMVVLHALLLAAAAAPSPPPSTGARVEARVSVRIVRGAPIRLAGIERPPEAAQATTVTLRLEDGRPQPAKLIEFE